MADSFLGVTRWIDLLKVSREWISLFVKAKKEVNQHFSVRGDEDEIQECEPKFGV
jgi:hypothetical protein